MRWLTRAKIIVPLSALLIAGTSSPASAHAVYNGWGEVWGPIEEHCLNEKVTEDHPGNATGGWFQNEVDFEGPTNLMPFGTVECSEKRERPAGYLKSKITVLKFVDPSWTVCHQTQWRVSSEDSHGLRHTLVSNPPGAALCGAGYYRMTGGAKVYWDNEWKFGSLSLKSDEYHWFPDDLPQFGMQPSPDIPDIEQGS